MILRTEDLGGGRPGTGPTVATVYRPRADQNSSEVSAVLGQGPPRREPEPERRRGRASEAAKQGDIMGDLIRSGTDASINRLGRREDGLPVHRFTSWVAAKAVPANNRLEQAKELRAQLAQMSQNESLPRRSPSPPGWR